MNSKSLNYEFTEIYPEILEYTIKAVKKANSKIPVNSLLSECYLHVDRWKDSIKDRNNLCAYSKTFIKNQINWQNTPVYLRETIKEKGEFQDNQFSDFEWIDTEYILEIIKEFELGLSPYKRRIFSIYWKGNMTKAKEISKHVGCSISTSYNIIHECRALIEDLRTFMKNKLDNL